MIALVFAVFERRRSISGVLRYLVDHEIALPDRVRRGPDQGDVCWNRPNRATRHATCSATRPTQGLMSMGDVTMTLGCNGRASPTADGASCATREGWAVLRQGALPAYIDWETFERNQEQMAANRARYTGVPRGGAALLGGLVTCGLCGRRMFTTYNHNGREARYVCHQLATTFGAPRCQSISAPCVDACVTAAMLGALSPSALEVSLQVAEDLELERQQRHGQWKQRLERAAYETALARRRYESVDPAHRLVARTLEHDWEAALSSEQTLSDNYRRACQREPERLSEEDKAAVRRLAEDIPALWQAASTTAQDRQTVARLMLDRVVILVHGATEHAEITCHWAGGTVTRHPLIRPVRRFEQLEKFPQLIARITELRQTGATAQAIADHLNAEGWRPPKKAAFDAPMIRRLLQRQGLGPPRPIWSSHVPRVSDDEMTLQELATQLGAHRQTVYGWLRRGTLKGRLAQVGTQRIWLVSRTAAATRTPSREAS